MTNTATLTVCDVTQRTPYRLYENCGYNFLADHAERQLCGRSHYYTADTRRTFGTRVNHVQSHLSGLLLCTIASDVHPEVGRIHRAVIHDITGAVIYRSCDDDDSRSGFKSTQAARNDLRKFLSEYHDESREASRVLEIETRRAEQNLELLYS